MESLRRLRRLTCQLLLVWFALALGVATAAPVLHPQSADVVCSGSGAMMVVPADDGHAHPATGHDHDCHQCVMVGAPPAPLVIAAHDVPSAIPALPAPATFASPAPAPFQPRGPPLP